MELNGASERLPVVIRAMGGRDLPGMVRLRGGVRLDLPETQLTGYTPLIGLVQGRWNPLRSYRVRTYVAVVNAELTAFIQARERSPQQRHKWDVVFLGTGKATAVASGERRSELWTALLDYTTTAASRRGVQRLFARLPVGSEAAAAFRDAGYVRYGEETIYLLHGHRAVHGRRGLVEDRDEEIPPDGPGDDFAIRPQAHADTWAVHQLYTLTAPKASQYAEALTSHRWELPGRAALRRHGLPRETGFVVERGHEIAIYCRVGRRGNRARLEFVFDPAARDWLAPAIEAVLHWLAPGPGDRVYCAVREFQEELGSALLDHGFTVAGVQEALVRYTTVSARSLAVGLSRRAARGRRLVGVPAGSLRRQPVASARGEAREWRGEPRRTLGDRGT